MYVLPHHLDLTLFPFGPKMHCRDKEYYNGQQGKEYQDMKKGLSKGAQICKLIYKGKKTQSINRKQTNLNFTSNANQHMTLLKA